MHEEKKYEKIQAVYLHIPFCRQKCLYCDFASFANCGVEVMTAYTEALLQEIAERRSEAGDVCEQGTIYFGGGTPSSMPYHLLARIVEALKEYGFWRKPGEATIEVNPGTINEAELKALRQLGFDRVSFGVQSLQDAELKNIGRIHSGRDALTAVAAAKKAGFQRINMDIMYGLPGQTLDGLEKTLTTAVSCPIEHISVYGLVLEDGTPLKRMTEDGTVILPNEDAAADMYDFIQQFLQGRGFERYEISNYAKQGSKSLHNLVYWSYRPYVGFGVSACSFTGKMRRTACSDLGKYISFWRNLRENSDIYEEEELTNEEAASEYMFMRMRITEGADLAEVKERFGVDILDKYGSELEKFFKEDLLVLSADRRYLRLTAKGMSVGNLIFRVFV